MAKTVNDQFAPATGDSTPTKREGANTQNTSKAPGGNASTPAKTRKPRRKETVTVTQEFIDPHLKGGKEFDYGKIDKIHVMFLLYSGAHNAINSWQRADNVLFFIFVFVGVLSVEFMLWELYKMFKKGRLLKKMKGAALAIGSVAMFYATAGIIAHVQGGLEQHEGGFLAFHYDWIMPTGAPAMFVGVVILNMCNPLTWARMKVIESELDYQIDADLDKVEKKQGRLDVKKANRKKELENEKRSNNLIWKIKNGRLSWLFSEYDSRRTTRFYKAQSRAEMPVLLATHALDERLLLPVTTSDGVGDEDEGTKTVDLTVPGKAGQDTVNYKMQLKPKKRTWWPGTWWNPGYDINFDGKVDQGDQIPLN